MALVAHGGDVALLAVGPPVVAVDPVPGRGHVEQHRARRAPEVLRVPRLVQGADTLLQGETRIITITIIMLAAPFIIR